MSATFGQQVALVARRKRSIYENGNYAIIYFSCNGKKFREQLPPPKGALQEFGATTMFVARGNIPHGFEGTIYELSGEWVMDAKRQEAILEITSADIPIPTKEKDIAAFLRNCKGIGLKKANRIAEAFGSQCIDVCVNNPELITQTVSGITTDEVIALKHHCQQVLYQQEIRQYLNGINIPKEAVDAIADAYKEKAVEVMKTKPYRLIEVVPFSICDAIAKKIGLNELSASRIVAGLYVTQKQCVRESGSICIYEYDLIRAARKLLGNLSQELLLRGLSSLYKTGVLQKQGKWVYNKEDLETEKNVARNLVERIELSQGKNDNERDKLKAALERWKKKSPIQLSERQEQAVMGLTNYISVVTGGPGTGKSTALKACLECFEDAFQCDRILCIAPTGRAAKRMAECTGYPAQTIHQAFALIPADNRDGFVAMDEANVDVDLVAIDETSMVGIHIFEYVLSTLKPTTRIVLLGDVYQLPSVSPGNVLYDLIASQRIKVTILDRNYRQGSNSTIADNGETINNGSTRLSFDDTFRFDDCRNIDTEAETETAIQVVADEYINKRNEYGVKNTIILSPTHYYRNNKSSLLCTDKLNELIQDRINPASSEIPYIKANGKVYRLNDRVVQTKNNSEAMNGDLGTITRIWEDDGITKVQITFDDGNTAKYDKSEMMHVDLGYCITVHKAQGSEFACCIMPASMTQRAMLIRRLFYTGVTRAKKEFIFVGSRTALDMAIHTLDKKRKSLLPARIQVMLKKRSERKART